ncbi:MAG: YCF48-related protein [Pseudomonadota bacterium]
MLTPFFLRRYSQLLRSCAPRLSMALLCGAASMQDTAAVPGTSPVPAVMTQPAAGASWASRALMLSVARAGSSIVAVGEHGFILLSGDDGRSWSQARKVPTSVTLTRVRFATATEGWAVGHMGVVLHTVDAGVNWVRVTDGAASARLALEQAEALGAGREPETVVTLRTSAAQLVQDGPDKPLLALLPGGPGRALALGAFGTGVRIEGEPARPQSMLGRLDNPAALHVYGVSENGGIVYAAGEQGLLLRSRQGEPFVALASPYKGTYFGVLALSAEDVLAYGLRGSMFRSADGGKTWIRIECGTQQSISSAIVLADGSVLLGSQGGQLLLSQDGGRSFSLYTQAPQPVTDLVQASDGTVIVAGPRGVMRIVAATKAGA